MVNCAYFTPFVKVLLDGLKVYIKSLHVMLVFNCMLAISIDSENILLSLEITFVLHSLIKNII